MKTDVTETRTFKFMYRANKIIEGGLIAWILIFPFAFTFFLDWLLELSKGMTSAMDEGIYIGPILFGFLISFFTGIWMWRFWAWIIKKFGYQDYI